MSARHQDYLSPPYRRPCRRIKLRVRIAERITPSCFDTEKNRPDPAFRAEGVDIDGLILLSSGKWDQDTYVAPKADGSEERMTEVEVEARGKKYFGRFQVEVGTLAGEISFTTP